MSKIEEAFQAAVARKCLLSYGACLAVMVLSACNGSPPKAECLRGEYTLNKDAAVHLVLDRSHFRLTAHGESVTGRYEYEGKSRENDMPGSGNIAFYPEAGRISDQNKQTIFRESGRNRDVASFLDSIQSNKGAYRPVYEGAGSTVNIVLDSDLDTIALEFSKTGCS